MTNETANMINVNLVKRESIPLNVFPTDQLVNFYNFCTNEKMRKTRNYSYRFFSRERFLFKHMVRAITQDWYFRFEMRCTFL